MSKTIYKYRMSILLLRMRAVQRSPYTKGRANPGSLDELEPGQVFAVHDSAIRPLTLYK